MAQQSQKWIWIPCLGNFFCVLWVELLKCHSFSRAGKCYAAGPFSLLGCHFSSPTFSAWLLNIRDIMIDPPIQLFSIFIEVVYFFPFCVTEFQWCLWTSNDASLVMQSPYGHEIQLSLETKSAFCGLSWSCHSPKASPLVKSSLWNYKYLTLIFPGSSTTNPIPSIPFCSLLF